MTPRRHELTDEEWAVLQPLLPHPLNGGRRNHDHRVILNGMLFRLFTGVPWRDLPDRYGPWRTVYSRYRRWTQAGVWQRVLAALQRDLDAMEGIDWTLWCIDGSNVRAHKAAAGAKKKLHAVRTRRSRTGT